MARPDEHSRPILIRNGPARLPEVMTAAGSISLHARQRLPHLPHRPVSLPASTRCFCPLLAHEPNVYEVLPSYQRGLSAGDPVPTLEQVVTGSGHQQLDPAVPP